MTVADETPAPVAGAQSDADIQQMLRDEIADLNDRMQDRFREIAALTEMLEEAEARHQAELAHQHTVLTRRYEVPGLVAQAAQRRAQAGFPPDVAPLEAQKEALAESPLFDAEWYLETYADVAEAKLDPVEHYLTAGWSEWRDPSSGFSTREYYMANPDVAEAGWPALAHFVILGADEDRILSLDATRV